jgi:hypothetical protein
MNAGAAVEIVEGVKAKHVRIEGKNKELRIGIREFDNTRREIVEVRLLKVKGSEQMHDSIKTTKQIVFNKHFYFVSECLEKTLARLPLPSLI